MIESLERRSLSPIFEMSIPSIVMLPQQDSMMRNKASVIEDFPAPVRPTIPIYMQKQSKVFNDILIKFQTIKETLFERL